VQLFRSDDRFDFVHDRFPASTQVLGRRGCETLRVMDPNRLLPSTSATNLD
jgi:hypothetical protein